MEKKRNDLRFCWYVKNGNGCNVVREVMSWWDGVRLIQVSDGGSREWLFYLFEVDESWMVNELLMELNFYYGQD